jgi:hypothetical protein
MPRISINAFNAGEISPVLDSRTDTDKYKNACRICENCVPKIQGGAFGRAGFEFMGAARYNDKGARLIPFTFNITTNFVLELGDLYMRFWSNGLQVQVSGSPYQINTPYALADLFTIQFAQVNDVMYLVNGTTLVQKLVRLSDTNWTLTPVDWKFPALQDENVTTTTVACSVTTGSGTLTASAALFDVKHVGSYFQIAHRRDAAFASLGLTGAGNSSDVRIIGKYDVFTYGNWTGTVNLQRKNDAGSWETIRSWNGNNDRNIQASGSQDEEAIFRLSYTGTGGSTPPRAVLEPADSRIYGVVKVTGFTNSTHVSVTVIKDLWATSAVSTWSEGAWSDFRGHPRTVTIDQQRLCFGGTAYQPLNIWGSVIGDFENFKRTTLADASYAFQIASPKGNSIVWITSQTRFMVGTQGDEWLIDATGGSTSSGSGGTIITSGNVNVQLQTSFGSAYIQPVQANDTMMFVQRGRKRLREFVFQYERQAFGAPDLNLLAAHMLDNTGVKQIAFASNPDPVVWIVTEDGRLLSMTFERDQNVVGWSRHTTDGTVESVAVIPGGTSLADEVWITTKRTVISGDTTLTKRYIERLDPAKWQKLEGSDIKHMIYLDCAKVTTLGSPSVTVTGLDHLEGREVGILADGFNHPRRTVRSGTIVLQQEATVVVVGLPFVPRIQPTKLDIPMQDGTAQGRKFKTHRATLRFWKTIGCEYSDSPTSAFYDVPFRNATTEVETQEALFTGQREVFLNSIHRDAMDMTLQQVAPLPFHVLAMSPVFSVTGQ